MEHIARISHGKDSLKMLDVIISRGLPLDRITTTDVWATETVRGEHPEMVKFKDRADEYIWKKYRIEVEHLCARNKDGSKKTYEQMFYHVPVRRSQTVQVERERETARAGTILGLPDLWHPWCQAGLKRSASAPQQGSIKGFPGTVGVNWCQKLKLVPDPTPRISCESVTVVQKTQDRQGQNTFSDSPPRRAKRNIVEYLGIAADEPRRFAQLNERKRAPLVEFGIEEDLCGLHCQYEGILAPSYEASCRDGCWMCHNQGVNSLRQLRKNYPDLWALLLKWDADSPITFHADGRTVRDFDRRFEMEDMGLLFPDDKGFRWSLLEDELNYRWF